MKKLFEPMARKALVVAHPDDETLWAGGLLARANTNCREDWTVICCSMPYKAPIRAWKFQTACLSIGVKFMIYPMFEGSHSDLNKLNDIDLSSFEVVVTHNHRGEYGHRHHVAVHNYVCKNFKGEISCFGYGLNANELVNAERLALTDDEFSVKMRMLRCYDHMIEDRSKPVPCYQDLLEFVGRYRFNLQNEMFVTL
jgi:hypothetical protein